MKDAGVTEGRIVHYVLPNGEHCAAMIVRAWDHGEGQPQLANLTLFPDSDTAGRYNHAIAADDCWKTSIKFSEDAEPNTWHWIEQA